VVLYSLAAGGTLIIYLRFVCGWRLGDLMYVTRASLSRSLTSVTSGTASARRCRPAQALPPPPVHATASAPPASAACALQQCRAATEAARADRRAAGAGMEGLTQRLAGVKSYLQQQVAQLRAKQAGARELPPGERLRMPGPRRVCYFLASCSDSACLNGLDACAGAGRAG